MNNGIYEPNEHFDFDKLVLLKPTLITGGNHFIKFKINEIPLYVQPPKCKVKQCIHGKQVKKNYCDLLFSNEHDVFFQWIENLETHCQKIMHENREKWFETELDENDIENSFNQSLKVGKLGKSCVLRTNVPTILGKCSLKIYNEQEQEINMDDLTEECDVMLILEFKGIKCSPRNFQIDIEIKQMMVLNTHNLFEKCIFTQKREENCKMQENNVVILNHETTEQHMDCDNNINNETIEQHMDCDNNINNEITEQHMDCHENNNEIEQNYDTSFHENEREETNDVNIEVNEVLTFPVDEPEEAREVDINLNDISTENTFQIKKRNDIYIEMYKEAKRKAKIARDLAVFSFLEAKKIKNTFLLDEHEDSDDDLDDNYIKSIIHLKQNSVKNNDCN